MSRPSHVEAPLDCRPIYDLVYGRHALTMSAFAQERGLFDLLASGPRDLAEIATATETEGRVTEAMLAVSTSLGLLERDLPDRWALSELGRSYLVPSSPYFFGPLVRADHPELVELRRACLETRGPTQPLAVGIEDLPEDRVEQFIARMHQLTWPAATVLGRNAVFRDVQRLLDVGAGSGSLTIGIALENAGLRATLLDVPAVCRIAREKVERHGLSERIATCAANMFQDAWPRGHDGILLGNIFHDWDEESCRQLAARAYEALEPGGRIFLHEITLNDEKSGPLTAACFSVAMILFEKGRQYTVRELHGFLEEAGFVDARAQPSFGHYWLVSASKTE